MPQIGAGVWVEFEQGDPDYPIWAGCFWGSAAEVPALALAGAAGAARASCCRRRCRTASSISDLPGPTGGIMLKSATGATIIVNDTGIYIQNGKGASIVMTGPTVTINNGALTVIVRCPGPLLHLGATVLCAHGGQAQPTAPNPRVLVSGQPMVTMAAPVRRRRLPVRRRRGSRRPASPRSG